MHIGYARVSTHVQNLGLQRDALEKAGCKKIFIYKVSGVAADRTGIEEALSHLREGDTLKSGFITEAACAASPWGTSCREQT